MQIPRKHSLKARAAFVSIGVLLSTACGDGTTTTDAVSTDTEQDGTNTETDNGDAPAGTPADQKITVAYQPGLLYSPAMIVKDNGCLEETVEGLTVEWEVIGSGADLRAGMLSDNIDIGIIGSGAFVVGWAADIDWKYLMSYVDLDSRLMVMDDKYQTIEDFKEHGGKISTVAPDAPVATMVRVGAAEAFGDPRALDSQFVALDHPTSVQALLGGEIQGYTATPPFIQQVENEGARAIYSTTDAWPDGLMGVGPVAMDGFVEENPEIARAFEDCSEAAIDLLLNSPDEAAEAVAKVMGSSAPAAEELVPQLEAMVWTTEPNSLLEFFETTQEYGIIDKSPDDIEEVFFAD